MLIKLNPLDTLLFRTPAPFNAGEDYTANSIFPPNPHTYAGIAREYGVFASKEKKARQFKIEMSGIMLNEMPLFQQPLDLYRSDLTNEIHGEIHYCDLEEAPVSNYPLPYITGSGGSNSKTSHLANTYFPLKEVRNYLNANPLTDQFYDSEALYKTETHVGIAIDPMSKTTISGNMYQRHMVRLFHQSKEDQDSEVSLFFKAAGVDFENGTVVNLGGRDKKAVLKTVDVENSIGVSLNSAKYFKLYFATPALFQNGWIPKWVRPNSKGVYDGVFTKRGRQVKVKLLAACVGNYTPIGGFGSGSHVKPKEMNYAVPAGSVYYFELLEGKMEDVVKLFHQRCISDYRENLGFEYEIRDRFRYCDRGYGYALVGNLTKNQMDELDRRS